MTNVYRRPTGNGVVLNLSGDTTVTMLNADGLAMARACNDLNIGHSTLIFFF